MNLTTMRHHLVFRHVAEMASRGLIPGNARAVVAVSGGPDSICLLSVLDELRRSRRLPDLALHIAHVNYGLRGAESDADEGFVRDMGVRFDIPVSCERPTISRMHSVSLQEHARAIRYAFFDRLCRDLHFNLVATGHTADDQAETVLLWLLHGAGADGLSGIPVMRDLPDGRIIRPLLQVPREQVLDYLASRHLSYRVDSSNATVQYRRNRIRHELLPLLKSYNPRIVEGLARSAAVLAADTGFLKEASREALNAILIQSDPGRVVLDSRRLGDYPVALKRRIIRHALGVLCTDKLRPSLRHVEAVLAFCGVAKQASLCLPERVRVSRRGVELILSIDAEEVRCDPPVWTQEVPLPVPGSVHLGEGQRLLAVNGRSSLLNRETAVIDLDRVGGPLTVRAWQPGDWFCPTGLRGHHKKLHDYFIDEKIPRNLRKTIPLVSGPHGIVWVVGYRTDQRFIARDVSSHPVTLRLEYEV